MKMKNEIQIISRTQGYKMVYSAGTSVATLVPLMLAYDMKGFKMWAVAQVCCVRPVPPS